MRVVREVERCIAAIRSQNSAINAFVNVRAAASLLKEAADVGNRLDEDKTLSPIDGTIIAVKDNICTHDMPTTCASEMLRDYTSPFEATVVSDLRKRGAIVIGKTNMDEFGMGSHSVNSAFGPVARVKTADETRNRSAGGSSGGSAAAVAASMCHAALGTDTGGSIRTPAAYCGIVGFKPSYGMISRYGVIPYANSLDTVGILANDIKTVKALYSAINHPDKNDPTCITPETRQRISDLAADYNQERLARPLRIGVPREYNMKELHEPQHVAWNNALARLSTLGHTLHPVSLPSTESALQAYYIIAPAEASSNLAKYDGVRYGFRSQDGDWPEGSNLFGDTRGKGFGDEVRRRILLGNFTLSAGAIGNYFLKAQEIRRKVKDDFSAVFAFPDLTRKNGFIEREEKVEDLVDVLVTPTTLSPAPDLEDVMNSPSTIESYVNDVLTVPASLAGIPAISMPMRVGTDVVGVQVMGQYGDEDVVLRVGEMLENLV